MYHLSYVLTLCVLSALVGSHLSTFLVTFIQSKKPQKGSALPYDEVKKILDQTIDSRIKSFLFIEDAHYNLSNNIDLKNTIEKKVDLTDEIMVGLTPVIRGSLKLYMSNITLREYIMHDVFCRIEKWVVSKNSADIEEKKVNIENNIYDRKVEKIISEINIDLSHKHSREEVDSFKPILKEIIDRSDAVNLEENFDTTSKQFKQLKGDILYEFSEVLKDMSMGNMSSNKEKEYERFMG